MKRSTLVADWSISPCWRSTGTVRRADQLYERYTDFGKDPFVVALEGAPRVKFSAWTYAQQRAQELAAPGQEGEQRRRAVLDRKRR